MKIRFFRNFFRTDLELNKRWWHRLLAVIFFASFTWSMFVVFHDLIFNDHPDIPQWKIADSVNDRITSKVVRISDIKKLGEKIAERGSSFTLNLDRPTIYDDFYCSSNIEDYINEVQEKSGIRNLYLNKQPSTIEDFTRYLEQNNIQCLVPDSYSLLTGEIKFLEPLGSDHIFGDDLVFYEKSIFLTVFYTLRLLSIITLVFLGIIITYYKIILYIIFGR